jgi:hypothetical protein
MPRKSAAELATVSRIKDHLPRITAPDGMSREELTLFRKIVEDCHPLHFAQSDAPLLRAYCQACVLGEMAFEAAQQSPDALGDWEKCCKTMAALSVKLRLNPHSRSDPKTIMRAIAGQSLPKFGGVSLETLAAIRDGARGWAVKG